VSHVSAISLIMSSQCCSHSDEWSTWTSEFESWLSMLIVTSCTQSTLCPSLSASRLADLMNSNISLILSSRPVVGVGSELMSG
jgi:hypothetical protein